MDQTSPSTSERFFVLLEGKTNGPFDLIELAGQLRVSQINAETPVRREGMDDWKPFRDLPEFAEAQQIPIEVIARHLEKNERVGDANPVSKKDFSAPWETLAIILVLLAVAGVVFKFSKGPMPARPPPVQVLTAPNKEITFSFPRQYSAEISCTTRSSGLPITAKIYKDGDKVRTEVDSMGGDGVFINRPDLGKVYQLHASTKTITQHPLQDGIGNLGVTGPTIRFESIGTLLTRGINCGYYILKLDGKTSFVLVDPNSHAPMLLMAYDGTVAIEYKNFRTGPPAASKFELPADYRIISNEQ